MTSAVEDKFPFCCSASRKSKNVLKRLEQSYKNKTQDFEDKFPSCCSASRKSKNVLKRLEQSFENKTHDVSETENCLIDIEDGQSEVPQSAKGSIHDLSIMRRKAGVILPVELWTMILGLLDFPDLCSMLLLSRHMYQVGTHPSFLRKLKISRLQLAKQIGRHGFNDLFSVTKSPRFDLIQKLDLSNFFQNTREWSNFFKKLSSSKKFPDLKLTNVNLCDIPAKLLSKAISGLCKVDLYRTRLRSGQCRAILSASLESTSLEEINLGWNNLSHVPASILAKVVARLRVVNLEYTWLRPIQVRKILRESLNSTCLEDLDLKDVSTRGVSPRLLAMAICRLVRVNLSFPFRGSREQVEEILKVLPDSESLINLQLGIINKEFETMASEALAVMKKKRGDNCDGLLLQNRLSLTHKPS